MPIKIRAADARNNFAEILGRAHFGGETFLIEKQGKPFAVVLGIEEYRRLLGATSGGSAPVGEPASEGRNGRLG
ncbi:MAG: type II toxin-antitoxin system Phd/YefM family antitoxin [Chloroflexota bacterium]